MIKVRKIVEETVEKFITENFNRVGLKEISLDDAIKKSQLSDIKDIGEWLNKPIEDISFFYKKESISKFNDTIEEMLSTYDEFPDELKRTKRIYKLLENGKKPMPIFIKLDDKDDFIMEGRHRIVAFYWFGLDDIPVIYVE